MRYLIESALCMAAFYGLYHFLLRRETFFQWNRAYLLLAPLLAMLLPMLKIKVQQPASTMAEVQPIPTDILPEMLEKVVENPLTYAWQQQWQQQEEAIWSLSLWDLVLGIYVLIAMLLLGGLGWRFAKLFSLIKKCRKQRSGDVVIATGDALPLASFFSYVFWNDEAQKSDFQEFILTHEIAHARQWHSLDVLFMELMLIIQWFNPLMYAYRRSLSAVHEYIADDYVVRRTQQRHEYATLLVQQAGARAQHGHLYNTFHSLIKHRLLMLIKRPSHPLWRAKYALALPLTALLMLLFSFRLAERLPAAKPFVQALEKADAFVHTLDGITVVASMPKPPEKTPYIFYWGTMQCEILYDPATDRYFGEAVQSPEQWREGLRREPRLWNGQTLEQHLSLSVQGMMVRSDYYNTQLYAECRRNIEAYMNALTNDDVLLLQNVALPQGKKASIRILMDGEVPNWLQRNRYESTWSPLTDMFPDRKKQLTWGTEPTQEGDFITLEKLKKVLENQPVVTFENGEKASPDSCWIALFFQTKQGGFLVPNTAEYLRKKLAELNPAASEMLQKQAVLNISDQGRSEKISLQDLRNLLAPLSPEEVSMLNIRLAKGDKAIASMPYRTVLPDDPRLALNWNNLHKFVFEWGNIAENYGSCYGRSFWYRDSLIYADRRIEHDRYTLKVKDALETFRLMPRLYRDQEELKNLRFTLQLNEDKTEVINGVISPDFMRKLEKIKPYDYLYLYNIQADGHDLGHIKITHRIFSDLEKTPLKTTKLKDGELRRQLAESLQVLPNPVTDVLRLKFDMPQAAKVHIRLMDIKGQRTIQEVDYQTIEGQNIVALNAGLLMANGSYVIYMDTPFGRATAVFEKI